MDRRRRSQRVAGGAAEAGAGGARAAPGGRLVASAAGRRAAHQRPGRRDPPGRQRGQRERFVRPLRHSLIARFTRCFSSIFLCSLSLEIRVQLLFLLLIRNKWIPRKSFFFIYKGQPIPGLDVARSF